LFSLAACLPIVWKECLARVELHHEEMGFGSSLPRKAEPVFSPVGTHYEDDGRHFLRLVLSLWRNQTAPHRMTGEKATKIIADGRTDLEAKLVPSQMTHLL